MPLLFAVEGETLVTGLIGAAGGIWALYERFRSVSKEDQKEEYRRQLEREKEQREQTQRLITIYEQHANRAMERLETQQKDHMQSRELVAKLSAQGEAQQREIQDLRRRLDECEQRQE